MAVGKKFPIVVFSVLAFFYLFVTAGGDKGGGRCTSLTEYTEWQRPLSGAHSVMMEKSAQAGEGGGGVHTHSLSINILSRTKLWCTLQLRGQILYCTLPLFLL
jgi:hypothetical protein